MPGTMAHMEFAEVVRRRRMVRDFSDEPLDPGLIEKILANAHRAPSAGFSQGWAFLTLTEAADRDRFWPFVPNQLRGTPGMTKAPLIVIPLAHKAAYLANYFEPGGGWEYGTEDQWPAPYWDIDTGMAALLMLLTAVDEGLGGFLFWIMPPFADGFDGDKVPAHLDAFRAEFGIPGEYRPVGAIAIGHRAPGLPPQDPSKSGRRRDIADVVHHGQWDRR